MFDLTHYLMCMSLKYGAHQAFTLQKSLISENHFYTFNVSMLVRYNVATFDSRHEDYSSKYFSPHSQHTVF